MIGVIGGSGLYGLDDLKVIETVNPETPWGFPSAPGIVLAETSAGTRVAFLARHGKGHYLNPSEVNSRANIAALKHVGCKVILSFSAVGSLREEIAPKHFVIPSQIIDRTKGIRPSTYFEGGLVAHTTFADPFDSSLRDLVFKVAQEEAGEVVFHKDKTLICMEGPVFSTRAESLMYRSFGGDLINMSAIPETKLAREAELPYVMICMSTDYDAWRESEEGVNVTEVMETMQTNSKNAKAFLGKLIERVASALEAGSLASVNALQGSMKFACVTGKEQRSTKVVEKLNFILPGYY
ncbi:MAG: hypothetical protein SGCHY_005393 [Lobulomycetales sp.]